MDDFTVIHILEEVAFMQQPLELFGEDFDFLGVFSEIYKKMTKG